MNVLIVVEGRIVVNCFEMTYRQNLKGIENYCWWRHGKIPRWESLCFKVQKMEGGRYIALSETGRSISLAANKSKNNTRCFFQNLERPLLVKNEMNIYHWEYLMDNVRSSENYGGDNHIYMYYDTKELFLCFLQIADITKFLKSKKFIFVFGMEELSVFYPMNFSKYYKISYDGMHPNPVSAKEIHRIILIWQIHPAAGYGFFVPVMEQHKNFLSMQPMSLDKFSCLYQRLLHKHSVYDLGRILKKNVHKDIFDSMACLFIPYGDRLPQHGLNVDDFFSYLIKNSREQEPATKSDWLKIIALTNAHLKCQRYTERIVPAVFLFSGPYVSNIRKEYDLFREFKYFRALSMIRCPTISIGANCDDHDIYKDVFFENIYSFFSDKRNPELMKGMECAFSPMYLEEDDEFLPFRGIVRFEDLKLYPRAALESICDFLDIPWDDAFFHEKKGYCGGKSIIGFDTSPVYNPHNRMFSEFDFYRLELLMEDEYKPWGYMPHYHLDGTRFTKNEILKLFKEPLKCEDFHFTKRQKDRLESEKAIMYKIVEDKVSRPLHTSSNGKKLVPIQWIKPKKELMNGNLYE